MAKLFVEIKDENGRIKSLSSNERLEATIYEGTKKQYSLYIEWGEIGDIAIEEGDENLPEFNACQGSTISYRDWRTDAKYQDTCKKAK